MVIEPSARGITQVRLTFEDVIGTLTRTRDAEVRTASRQVPKSGRALVMFGYDGGNRQLGELRSPVRISEATPSCSRTLAGLERNLNRQRATGDQVKHFRLASLTVSTGPSRAGLPRPTGANFGPLNRKRAEAFVASEMPHC